MSEDRSSLSQIHVLVTGSAEASDRTEMSELADALEQCQASCLRWRDTVRELRRGFATLTSERRASMQQRAADQKYTAALKALSLGRMMRRMMREALAGWEPAADERGTTLAQHERVLISDIAGTSTPTSVQR